jgi:hypothetical protein
MLIGLWLLIDGISLGVIAGYLIRSASEDVRLSAWTLVIPLATLFMALSIVILGLAAHVKFVVIPQTLKSLVQTRDASN